MSELQQRKQKTAWDDRYAAPHYIYGTTANDWIATVLDDNPHLAVLRPDGSRPTALELACGEGRNAVYLAKRGFSVTAVDMSEVGIEKTQRLAADNAVQMNAICGDALTWRSDLEFDLVVATWFHLPADRKPAMFLAIRDAVKPGGTLIAEWFHPDQRRRGYTSGGPPAPEMMFTLGEVREGLSGFTIDRLIHRERTIREGPKHDGPASVVSVVARRRDN